MRLLDKIIEHNRSFVEKLEYEKYQTTKFPDKRLVILSCMDTRLVELLPQALNLKNGDVKIIKNAGAIVAHPFGSIMRSILVAVYELHADEICVIGHHDCGMSHIDSSKILDNIEARGVPKDKIETLKYSGIDLHRWFEGFSSVEESVEFSVNMIKKHPLLPPGIAVHGLVIDPKTGHVDIVIDGYELEQKNLLA